VAFYQGLAPHEAVPWAAWTPVVIGWGIGFAFVVMFSIGACALFRRQWQDRERLTFPLAQLAVMLVSDAQARSPLTRNRLFWLGAGAVILHHTITTLNYFYPSVPDIPLRWDISSWQQVSPWTALNIWNMEIFFVAVGAIYLIPTEVSFSLWFTFLAFHLYRVLRLAYGYEPRIPGPLSQEGAVGAGAFIVWTTWLLWLARPHWRRVWRAFLHPGSVDERGEPLSSRWALVATVGGFAGLVAWLGAAGVPLRLGLPFVTLFFVVLLVLTRIIAETGMLFLFPPFDVSSVMSVWGTHGFTPGGTGAMLMLEQVHADYREALMPAITNAFAISGRGEISPRAFGSGAALAITVGYFVGFVAFVYVSYRFGSVTLDPWGTNSSPRYRFDRALRYVQSPQFTHWGNLITIGVGGLLAASFAFLKTRFLWWPLGPVGLTLAGTYAMDRFWFSILGGWLCKVLTLRFGGLALYRVLLPCFIGLIVGESLFAGVSIIWSLLVGVSAPQFLPG
jgi:hypothetical protein